MTVGGWFFMLGSIAAVLALAAWSFAKVLTLPPAGPDSVAEDAPVVPPPPGT
jgi:hypothetical protein